MARGKGHPPGGRPRGRSGGAGTGPRGPVKSGGTGKGTGHKSSFASEEMIKAVYLTALIPLAVVLYVTGYFLHYVVTS